MLCLRVRVVYKVSCSPRRVKFLLGRKALEAGDAANKAFALGRNATLEGFNRAVADEAKTFAACLCWAKHATDRRKKRLATAPPRKPRPARKGKAHKDGRAFAAPQPRRASVFARAKAPRPNAYNSWRRRGSLLAEAEAANAAAAAAAAAAAEHADPDAAFFAEHPRCGAGEEAGEEGAWRVEAGWSVVHRERRVLEGSAHAVWVLRAADNPAAFRVEVEDALFKRTTLPCPDFDGGDGDEGKWLRPVCRLAVASLRYGAVGGDTRKRALALETDANAKLRPGARARDRRRNDRNNGIRRVKSKAREDAPENTWDVRNNPGAGRVVKRAPSKAGAHPSDGVENIVKTRRAEKILRAAGTCCLSQKLSRVPSTEMQVSGV